MSSRRFKKERHPFAYHGSPTGNSSNKSVSEEEEPVSSDDKSSIATKKQNAVPETNLEQIPPSYQPSTSWTPEIRTAVKLLLSARLCSVVWSHITDCDETFNYWEPLHYILHKTGFQTWEYSPDFAIRSYAYILLHALPLKLYDLLFHPDRLLMFYLLRLFLAVVSVGVEGYFYDAVSRKLGPNVARLLLVFQLFAPAFFISTTALLPSSFAMSMTTLAFALWFREREILAVTAVACSGLLGWPFAGILGLPIAFDILKRRGLFKFLFFVLLVGIPITGIIIGIDSSFYGRPVFPSLNIVLYNVISGHGPELYGVEPWHYYIVNGILNFNVAFILALLCPFIGGLSYFLRKKMPHYFWTTRGGTFLLGSCTAVLIWLGILLSTPHKEERFLFPIYSLLALLTACSLELAVTMGRACLAKFQRRADNEGTLVGLLLFVLILFSLVGTSRMFALSKFYGAPMDVYTKLHSEAVNRTVASGGDFTNLCVGKEWYRFPSSFFLPDKWRLQFIQSDFKGILPKPYAPYPGGLSIVPTEMNDANREEPTRYINPCRCDYLVDLSVEGKSSALEPQYAKKKDEWTVVFKEKFLDAARSHRMYRAFYIPVLSEKHCQFGDYMLLRRKRKCPAERKL